MACAVRRRSISLRGGDSLAIVPDAAHGVAYVDRAVEYLPLLGLRLRWRLCRVGGDNARRPVRHIAPRPHLARVQHQLVPGEPDAAVSRRPPGLDEGHALLYLKRGHVDAQHVALDVLGQLEDPRQALAQAIQRGVAPRVLRRGALFLCRGGPHRGHLLDAALGQRLVGVPVGLGVKHGAVKHRVHVGVVLRRHVVPVLVDPRLGAQRIGWAVLRRDGPVYAAHILLLQQLACLRWPPVERGLVGDQLAPGLDECLQLVRLARHGQRVVGVGGEAACHRGVDPRLVLCRGVANPRVVRDAAARRARRVEQPGLRRRKVLGKPHAFLFEVLLESGLPVDRGLALQAHIARFGVIGALRA